MTSKRNVIGLIGAMAEEVESILKRMEQHRKVMKAGMTFTCGTWLEKEIVVVKSGVGKVNAAMCAQILIDVFSVDTVIFTGVAGALDPALHIGDIVISRDCMHHDMDVSPLGFPRGTIPYESVSAFPSDPNLVQLALNCSRELFADRAFVGRVLTGDQFIADRSHVQWLHRELAGTCAEMEGAAVAQVCFLNAVPHVIIRSVSDRADGSAHADFQQFVVQAAENSFRIVERMLQKLGS